MPMVAQPRALATQNFITNALQATSARHGERFVSGLASGLLGEALAALRRHETLLFPVILFFLC